MGEDRAHSLILAAEYPVDDIDDMWRSLCDRELQLADIGAHHVVVYTSMWRRHRVMVTIGMQKPESVHDVLRSPVVFDVFATSRHGEIPAIFAGEVVEKIDIGAPSRDDTRGEAARAVPVVVVGVVTRVDDVRTLVEKVHVAADRFRLSGVRKVWIYSACDDSREALVLQEIEDEVSARRWLTRPDAAAEWMTNAGFGVSPKVFVGTLAHVLAVGCTPPAASLPPAETRVG